MQSQNKRPAANLLTFIVWLPTAAFAVYSVYLLHDLFFTLYARLGGEFRTGEVIRMVLLVIFAMGAIVYVIGSGEYHRKYVGKPKSLRLFGVTIGVELLIGLAWLIVG